MSNKKLISYVFPVFNEEKNLPVLIERLVNTIKPLEERYTFEFIFINDGSSDASLQTLISLKKNEKRIKIINFSRNFGQAMAFTAGLDYAKGEAVIIMDSDLQDPPHVSLEFIKEWENGFDVIYGQRSKRKDTFFKVFTAKYFYKIINSIADIDIPQDAGDFRLMDRKVVDEFKKLKERNRFIRGLIPYLGFNSKSVLFDRDERYAGHTKYSLPKMVKLALDGITSFSDFPVKIILRVSYLLILLGFISSILSLILAIIIGNQFLFFIFLMNYMTLMTGGILLAIGILGTYVTRIYSEVQNRPLYIVSDFIE